MDTNYYKVRKLSRQEKDKIIDAIENDRLCSVEYVDADGVEQSIEKREIYIHIGGASYKWKFYFDHNDWKYFGQSRKQIEEFINDPSMELIDEYGRSFTPKEFWEMVKNKETFTIEDGVTHEAWDMQSWSEKHPLMQSPLAHREKDIIIDNLRFSPFTDFA